MTREERALQSLDGLSVGDAFGEQFFGAAGRLTFGKGMLPSFRINLSRPPWRTTDDTEMAMEIVSLLQRSGAIDRDELASRFANRHQRDPARGYGGGAHRILNAISAGEPWQSAARSAFRGEGSKGNGGAMRAAPLGAWFADDLGALVREARSSAEVTHAHEEGQQGAIAVALAAAAEVRAERDLIEFVLRHLPGQGAVREGVIRAQSLGEVALEDAAMELGNGSHVLASDTVPLCLWMVQRRRDFADSLWGLASVLGDADTNCAIAGGILALRSPIPPEWLAAREPLRFSSR